MSHFCWLLTYKRISLDDLVIDTAQVRNRDVAKELDELVDSIRRVGLLEPIVVCPAEESGKFAIITGQRRFLAHRELQEEDIWAAVLSERVSETEAKVLSLTENLVRRDLNSRDLVDVCTYLFRQYGSLRAVSDETGLSYEKVRQYVKYEQLHEPLKALVDRNEVSIQTALRAQQAASIESPPNIEEAVQFAKAMAPMSGVQQKKIVENRQSEPDRPADDVIEDAKAGARITQVVVTLSSEVHGALGRYAESQGTNTDDAAGMLIRDGLYINDFLEIR